MPRSKRKSKNMTTQNAPYDGIPFKGLDHEIPSYGGIGNQEWEVEAFVGESRIFGGETR